MGKQSIFKDYRSVKLKSYDEWIETYVEPTVKNCVNYLINGGYLAINMKNTLSLSMYDDIYKILSENDELVFVCEEQLKNIRRPSSNPRLNTNEKIMVFQKMERKHSLKTKTRMRGIAATN